MLLLLHQLPPDVITVSDPRLFDSIHAISIRADLLDQEVVPAIEVTGDPALRVLLLDLPILQVIPVLPTDDLPFPAFQRSTEQVPSSVISIAFPPVYAVRPVDDPLFCQPPIPVIGSADLIPIGRGDLCQVPGFIISITITLLFFWIVPCFLLIYQYPFW